ncbi:MAG: ribosomal RNA small subunit methyltransferase A, partial [Zetaproteobacteria bacterium]
MMRAKKSLGQHFLIDRRAIERIVGAVPPGSTVLEIGPGRGALTLPLCARAAKVVAVEKDDALAAWWQAHAPKNLLLVHADALDLLPELLDAHAPDAIVGNLPYNISGPLTALLVEHARAPMVLMYQQEVAERICAKPGARAYGRLTALVAYRWRAELWFRLPPEAFRPRPKVRSAVVRFRPAD